MKSRGFRYAAVAKDGREARGHIWTPAFLPLELVKRFLMLVLSRVFLRVTTLETDPLLSLRVSSNVVALFTRRLSVMVAAGIPLHEAIIFLSVSEDETMNEATRELGHLLTRGNSFARSLAMLSGVFPSHFVGFVRVGENSGQLVQVLERLADQLERSLWISRRMRGALTYPLFLATGAVALSGLLVFSIVPMMAPTLQEINVELPWITVALLRLTEIGSHPLVIVTTLLVGLATFTAVGFLFSSTGRFTQTRRHLDYLFLNLPLSNKLLRQYSSARVLSAAGMSVETGIPVSRALHEASSLTPNTFLEKRLLQICESISEGVPFEEALDRSEAFSVAETQVLICASEAGHLADGMKRMARHAEEQMETTIGLLTSLLEPLILGLMSLVVGVVSLATFLPWVKLLQSIF